MPLSAANYHALPPALLYERTPALDLAKAQLPAV